MKVFNEEVKSCNDCLGYNGFECICTGEFIKYADFNKGIRGPGEECPFNKPITKEVIEGFGLSLISDKNNWCEFRNSKCDLYVNLDFQKPITLNIHSRGHSFIGNCKPKANNPVELEFILRSVGVIE